MIFIYLQENSKHKGFGEVGISLSLSLDLNGNGTRRWRLAYIFPGEPSPRSQASSPDRPLPSYAFIGLGWGPITSFFPLDFSFSSFLREKERDNDSPKNQQELKFRGCSLDAIHYSRMRYIEIGDAHSVGQAGILCKAVVRLRITVAAL